MTNEKKTDKKNGAFYYNLKCEPFYAMAFDNWLLDKIQKDKSFPRAILRLYNWEKPAITLGYNQNIDKVIDFNMLDDSIPVIKRITGGRAIFHDEKEITFSLTADLRIFPEKDRSLSKTNQLISGAVVKVLESVGITSRWMKKSNSSFSSSAIIGSESCFNSYSRYEIFSRKGKIVAGAQRREGNYFIHQGSLKINGISNCPAIGQKNEVEGVDKADKCGNSYVYTINRFQNLFPETFSEGLKIKLSPRMLDAEFHREVCFLATNQLKNNELFFL